MKKWLPLSLLFIVLQANAQVSTDSLNTRVTHIEKALKILREFRVIAYVQAQYVRADTAGARSFEGGDFPSTTNNRFQIRRGRVKLIFDHEGNRGFRIFQFLFQMDMTEKGFQTRDFWGRIIDPWKGWVGLQAGMMDRPFGWEVTSMDDFRESPDRGRMSQIIMPAEKDVGAELVIESPKTSVLANMKYPMHLRLDAGVFNGTGAAAGAFTGRKDFIGRLHICDTIKTSKVDFSIAGGTSMYYGWVMQSTPFVYSIAHNAENDLVYTVKTDSQGVDKKYYVRRYNGADIQLTTDYHAGTTILRAEFITGQQPGVATNPTVPVAVGGDIYLRKFTGVYAYFIQSFKHHLKNNHIIYHDFVFKYDYYNPNTQVKQTSLNSHIDSRLNYADIAFHTFGIGYIFRPYDFFQLQVYYDIIKNRATQVTGYTHDAKDNMLVIRAQFKFDTNWLQGKFLKK